MALMGKYIYCFIKEKEKVSFGKSSIGNLNAPIYTLPYKEISAVISNAPIIEYDPSRKNILAHREVIARVMKKYDIIPVAFGMVANNNKEIEAIINTNYDRFNDAADFLKGKIELGLKITWNKDFFNKDIEDNEIKNLKREVSGREEKEVLNEKIQLGRLVEEAMLSKREEYEGEIYNPLKELSVDSKLNDKLPVKTVMNAYFLVEKSVEAAFDSKVEYLSELYKNKLIFNYTGPWPAYNFVDLDINMKFNGN